jgi:hypothetical protein
VVLLAMSVVERAIWSPALLAESEKELANSVCSSPIPDASKRF